MKQVNVWDSNFSNSFTYINNIGDVIDYIKDNKIMVFSVVNQRGFQDDSITTYAIDILNKKAQTQDIVLIYTDENHPFFYDALGNVYFNKDFFDKNKDIIISAIQDLMFENENIHISKYVYSESLVKNLCLVATSISFDNDIKLSDEIKNFLKINHINAYFYKNGEKNQISTNKILGQDYKSVTSNSDDIYIKDNITDLDNLKYITLNKTIHITSSDKDNILGENYDNLYNIISRLRKNGQNNKVIIKIKNRNEFSKSKLYASNFDLVIEGIDIKPYTLEELKNEDQLLDLMVKDIKESNYSPFEKYIAVYNIVKKFKRYMENKSDKTQARNIRKILNNNYMVCIGYANLLCELSRRLGIQSYTYNVLTDISYDNGFTKEEKPVELTDHARVILLINDSKYDINGIYVADPTWDNDLKNDYYNHALMSFDKTGKEIRMFKLSSEDLILNVRNMEEFNYKINIFINRQKDSFFGKNLDEKQKEKLAIITLVHDIISILISLFPHEYERLKQKYPNILEGKIDVKFVNDFITDAGKIFIDNYGKDVLIDTIIEAASEVNKHLFSFDESKATIHKENLLETNIQRDKKFFPYYYDNHKIK